MELTKHIEQDQAQLYTELVRFGEDALEKLREFAQHYPVSEQNDLVKVGFLSNYEPDIEQLHQKHQELLERFCGALETSKASVKEDQIVDFLYHFQIISTLLELIKHPVDFYHFQQKIKLAFLGSYNVGVSDERTLAEENRKKQLDEPATIVQKLIQDTEAFLSARP